MNVGQLIHRLSALPLDTPVVMSMEDEPLGDYEVVTVDVERMEHDPTWDVCGPRVYSESPSGYPAGRCDPPRDVVLLGSRGRTMAVVDVEPAKAELDTGGTP